MAFTSPSIFGKGATTSASISYACPIFSTCLTPIFNLLYYIPSISHLDSTYILHIFHLKYYSPILPLYFAYILLYYSTYLYSTYHLQSTACRPPPVACRMRSTSFSHAFHLPSTCRSPAVHPLHQAQLLFPNVAGAGDAAKRVFQVIDRPPAIDSKSKAGAMPKESVSAIEFQRVNFTYPSRPDVKVLNNFSLRVESGKKVALVSVPTILLKVDRKAA